MKCPRKLYIVVSRRSRAWFEPWADAYETRKEAKEEADNRNRDEEDGVSDHRVEVFAKAD